MSASPEPQAPPGAVELREDVPLQGGAGGARCGGGPRLALAAFAALSLAVTAALLAQLHYGDYEAAAHGSVSASAAACSAAGARALRAGGRAADAAVAAALCLAVAAPHRTSLDASGALVYWEYRAGRGAPPVCAEWGGPAPAGPALPAPSPRPPRLLLALAALHARYGARPWADALQPAIQLARAGYSVPGALAAAATARGVAGYSAGARRAEPALAAYLESLQRNTSSELCARWVCGQSVRWRAAEARAAGRWRVWAGGAGGALGAAALAAAGGSDGASGALRRLALAGPQPAGVASGLAVVDQRDTYLALVAGLSAPFGSTAAAATAARAIAVAGAEVGRSWAADEPSAELDAAPALIADDHVCGTRYVVGAESGAALAQGGAALLAAGAGGAVRAVERARLLLLPGGELRPEPAPAASVPPLPAVNFVLQRGDALLSHADSRGGGVASRF